MKKKSIYTQSISVYTSISVEIKKDGTLRSRHGSLKPEVPRRREPIFCCACREVNFFDYKIKKKPLTSL